MQNGFSGGVVFVYKVMIFEPEILGILLYGLVAIKTQKYLYKTSTHDVYICT